MSNKHKADWTLSKDAYLVEQLKAQQDAGKRSDTGWKKEAWKGVINAFNAHFDLENNINQLKSRTNQLKKQYKTMKKLREQSGFGWDDLLHVVTADDDVWDQYLMVSQVKQRIILKDIVINCSTVLHLQVNPDAKQFRKSGLPLYDNFAEIFDGKQLVNHS
jgi:predicted nucleic acid-binding protein